jgi:hypothetical protein
MHGRRFNVSPASTAQLFAYRLLGYENRAIADDNFRDDTIEGGCVGPASVGSSVWQPAS